MPAFTTTSLQHATCTDSICYISSAFRWAYFQVKFQKNKLTPATNVHHPCTHYQEIIVCELELVVGYDVKQSTTESGKRVVATSAWVFETDTVPTRMCTVTVDCVGIQFQT